MNYRLSCYTNRVKGKYGYTIEKDGKILSKHIYKLISKNIKDNMIESVYRGLKDVQHYVNHEDILYIEIQNIHLTEWLNGMKEYNGYEEGLDKTFETLEGIDCKYKFIFNKNPSAKMFIDNEDVDEINGSGVSSILEEFK